MKVVLVERNQQKGVHAEGKEDDTVENHEKMNGALVSVLTL